MPSVKLQYKTASVLTSPIQPFGTPPSFNLPPVEESSAALEVALGCSWGKCMFCDFAKDKFSIHPVDKIVDNLKILSQLRPESTRLFLLGENAFVLDTDTLMNIFSYTKKYMPNIKAFAMYSRADDILRKSKEELEQLAKAGLSGLHIGVESGNDCILSEMNKGITANQTLQALQLLDAIGIPYYVTIIPGLGGKTLSRPHAIETARLLNQAHPRDIWCLKLKLWEGTPLYKNSLHGLFEPLTNEEILAEEMLLLENLNVDNCFFVDTTVLDKYTIQGMLPEQKPLLINAITQLLGGTG